ncbi:hypothetical protein [Streptomyces sp. NPDC048057]|uniref:hypothetical protein n=1 Tax=Streptomyces sp. NPDC048057 TaxID=3155628 RepID=UPI0033D2D7D8
MSARVDGSLAQDIRALRQAGLSYSQMVKWGVALLADVYQAAWQYRLVAVGETPELESYNFNRVRKESGPPWVEEAWPDRTGAA